MREQVLNGPIENFKVISGKGFCTISKQNDKENQGIVSGSLDSALIGTLYMFDICGGV